MQAVGSAHGTRDANGCISEQVVVGALRAADAIVVVGTGLLPYVARFSILEDLGPVGIYALVIALTCSSLQAFTVLAYWKAFSVNSIVCSRLGLLLFNAGLRSQVRV